MNLMRGLLFFGLTLGALAVTPAVAPADQWKQQNGHWYYWSDSNQCWCYQEGQNWLMYKDGAWMPWSTNQATTTYQSNYYAPTTEGYSGSYQSYPYRSSYGNYPYNSGFGGYSNYGSYGGYGGYWGGHEGYQGNYGGRSYYGGGGYGGGGRGGRR